MSNPSPLLGLPTETLAQIFADQDQWRLHRSLFICRRLLPIIRRQLYVSPSICGARRYRAFLRAVFFHAGGSRLWNVVEHIRWSEVGDFFGPEWDGAHIVADDRCFPRCQTLVLDNSNPFSSSDGIPSLHLTETWSYVRGTFPALVDIEILSIDTGVVPCRKDWMGSPQSNPPLRSFHLTHQGRHGFDFGICVTEVSDLVKAISSLDTISLFLEGDEWGDVEYAALASFGSRLLHFAMASPTHLAFESRINLGTNLPALETLHLDFAFIGPRFFEERFLKLQRLEIVQFLPQWDDDPEHRECTCKWLLRALRNGQYPALRVLKVAWTDDGTGYADEPDVFAKLAQEGRMPRIVELRDWTKANGIRFELNVVLA